MQGDILIIRSTDALEKKSGAALPGYDHSIRLPAPVFSETKHTNSPVSLQSFCFVFVFIFFLLCS